MGAVALKKVLDGEKGIVSACHNWPSLINTLLRYVKFASFVSDKLFANDVSTQYVHFGVVVVL